jgi:ribonuclease P protein component
MKPLGFPKKERLCSKKSIEKIFSEGKSIFSYPIKSAYFFEPSKNEEEPVQVLFVVPKRKFKHAVKRNAIRRRMREAYRLKKQFLIDWCLSNNIQLRIAFIYIASEPVDFANHQKAFDNLFNQFVSLKFNQ